MRRGDSVADRTTGSRLTLVGFSRATIKVLLQSRQFDSDRFDFFPGRGSFESLLTALFHLLFLSI
jgi:hypothetical protein